LDAIDDDLAPHIDDLAVRHVRLVLIQRLIHPIIHADPLSKILRRILGIQPRIIGARELDLLDVRHDQLLVVAFALDEQRLDAFGVAAVFDPPPSALGRVGGVEDRDEVPGGLEPLRHIVDRGFGGGFTHALAFFVRGVEEGGGGVRGRVTPVVAHVEAFGCDAQPSEISDYFCFRINLVSTWSIPTKTFIPRSSTATSSSLSSAGRHGRITTHLSGQ